MLIYIILNNDNDDSNDSTINDDVNSNMMIMMIVMIVLSTITAVALIVRVILWHALPPFLPLVARGQAASAGAHSTLRTRCAAATLCVVSSLVASPRPLTGGRRNGGLHIHIHMYTYIYIYIYTYIC